MYYATKTAKPIGIILMSAGLVFLFSQFVDIDLLLVRTLWPLFIIVSGLGFLAFAYFDKTTGKILAPLGTAIIMAGCMLTYQAWADHFRSWAYVWILTGPFSIGVGFITHGIFHNDKI